MAEKEYISKEEAIERLYDNSNLPIDSGTASAYWTRVVQIKDALIRHIRTIPAADVVEMDKVAEMLRIMFDDDCACNYNGNDEWLTTKCKYAETDCPTPKDNLGCWKEFVKHFLAKMDGGKHETD